MRRVSSHVFNRQAPQGQDSWFKIRNKAESDTTEVYIMDEIGGWWGTNAADFVSEIKKITTANIALHLNSPGGEVFDGVAIYNALKAHSAKVIVYVDGLAASAASFIAQAGDEIIMSRGSTMMIHDGLAFCVGNEADMLKTAEILDKISNNIADIYAARAGGTATDWRAQMREEVWYTAQEAVDAGLADKVSTDAAAAEAVEAANRWDLSIFNHSGRLDAPSPAEVRRTITNRAKEAPVADKTGVRNDTDSNETTPPVETDENVETDAQVEGDEEAQVEPPVAPPAPQNKVSGKLMSLVINGVASTDPKAIQAHIDTLEKFRDDTRDDNRKGFVAKLVGDKKVSAAQQDGLEVFALGLDAAQYDAWTKTWDVAPGLSILGQHTGGSNHEGDASQVEAAAKDKIEVLKGTVAQHKMSGMDPEKIKLTNSYKELKELLPTYEL